MNCSCHSLQKSNHEPIALVALYKKMTRVNRSYRLLKKSNMSDSIVICSFALKKRVIHKKKFVVFIMFLTVITVFPLFMPKSKSLLLLFAPLLFYKEQGEHFALVALYKRVAVSNSLPSLFKKEQNRDSLFGKERITISLLCSQKNE